MSVYELKPRFQSILRPISNKLAARGITPNAVTISALVLSIAEGMAIGLQPRAAWPLLLLPLILFVRMALNAIDGMIAREHSMQSIAGKYLNEIGDIVSDLALYMPFLLVFAEPLTAWLFAAFLIGTAVSEATGIMAEVVGGVRRYDGPMGKSDRVFAMSVLAFCIGFFQSGEGLSLAFALLMCAAVWLTVYRRYSRSLDDAKARRTT